MGCCPCLALPGALYILCRVYTTPYYISLCILGRDSRDSCDKAGSRLFLKWPHFLVAAGTGRVRWDHRQGASLKTAADHWCSRGWPCFPVEVSRAGPKTASKRPLTPRGHHSATLDPEALQWRGNAIGGVTGVQSDTWVLDVDGPEGRASLAQLIEKHGPLPETELHTTVRGGLHYVFRWDPTTEIRNRAGVLPGLDVRGEGGWIVLPPSHNGDYKLEIDLPPVPAPRWLIDLVAKSTPPSPPLPLGKRRVDGMLRAAMDKIRSAPIGQRNDIVNRECYSIAGFLRDAGVSVDEVRSELIAAAAEAEQPAEVVDAALRSGLGTPRPLPDDPTVSGDTVLATNKEGQVRPILVNAIRILNSDADWKGQIKHNRLNDTTSVVGKPLTDSWVIGLSAMIYDKYQVQFTTNTLHEAIVYVADVNGYDPLFDYLSGLTWDGNPRLDTWLSVYAGCEQDELSRVYGRKFLISAVARALFPGCQADSTLVLCEPRGGAGKTSLIRCLGSPAGQNWTSDSFLSIGRKDAYQSLDGVWIYELSELASVHGAELEAVKGFISATHDKYRPPYGKVDVVKARRTVFIGTTNEHTFLQAVDRRWWVRRVVGSFDQPALERDRCQLWAEAVKAYHDGETWWLDDTERRTQESDTEQYRQLDPWEDKLAQFLQGTGYATIDGCLTHLDVAVGDRRKAHEMRVGRILRLLGFERKRLRDGDRRCYTYCRELRLGS